MPYYQYLRYLPDKAERKRAAEGLLRLKDALAAEVPKKTIADKLLILQRYLPGNCEELQHSFRYSKSADECEAKPLLRSDRFSRGSAHRGDPGGVFNFYEHVYRPEDEEVYANRMPDTYHKKTDPEDKLRYYEVYWRTHEMSDHLSMWVELRINFSGPYLHNVIEESTPD